jgi:hypothetical protein
VAAKRVKAEFYVFGEKEQECRVDSVCDPIKLESAVGGADMMFTVQKTVASEFFDTCKEQRDTMLKQRDVKVQALLCDFKTLGEVRKEQANRIQVLEQ